MTSEQWLRVKEIFGKAIELLPDQREEFVKASSDNVPEVYEEVMSLLVAHATSGPLDRVERAFVAPLLSGLRDAPDPGAHIGHYEIVRLIGQGGMGSVYLARDTRLHRDVALKMLPASLSEEKEASARFFMEARAASALDHPNVCTIYGIDTTSDGRLYIAMAHYEGKTLKEWIREGGGTPVECLDIAIQIAEGLQAVHEAGIIHRDIKPANIMIGESGVVKIVDFGIARIKNSARLSRPGTRLGTAAYMAPEQIEDQDVDARIDIWSLGVVLYEMLTRVRPFDGPSNHAILNKVLEKSPAPLSAYLSDIPEAINRVVRKMLEKKREHRYATIEEVLEVLEACRLDLKEFDSKPDTFLPVVLTSFIGRTRDILECAKLLQYSRVLTLSGPGGIGKTRLAIEIATQLKSVFSDGVVFVSLGAVTDQAQVPVMIAHALDLSETSRYPLDDLKKELASMEMLLVLDNFEQVIEAGSMVTELLVACPGVRCIVTSRLPLGITGEQEYQVPPLDLPEVSSEQPSLETLMEYPAIHLFVERARATRATFTLTEENASDVVALCRRLDGLPLALELAAARVKLFTPAMLRRRLVDQIDLLKEGGQRRPERHQTLQQAIQWSYDLLDAPLQGAFRQLCIFSGGFTLDAAESILQDSTWAVDAVEAVSALLDHSLLQRRDRDNETRMYMLSTIRTFGLQRLKESGDLDAVKERHAVFFTELAESKEPLLTGPRSAPALDALEGDDSNFRAALSYAKEEQRILLGLRLSASLWRYTFTRGNMHEGRVWVDQFLQMNTQDVPPDVLARAYVSAASLAHNQGDNNQARMYLENSLPLWREAEKWQGMISALNNLSWVACELGNLDSARAFAEEALTLCDREGEMRGKSLALNNLAWVAMYRGEAPEMLDLHAKSKELRMSIGDDSGLSYALSNIAHGEVMAGNYDRALELTAEAIDIARKIKDRHHAAWGLIIMGMAYNELGAYQESVACLEESLTVWHTPAHPSGLAWSLTVSARAHAHLGEISHARALLEESLKFWKQTATPWGVAWVYFEQGIVAELGSDYDEAIAWFTRSREMNVEVGNRLGVVACDEALKRIP